MKKTTIHKSKVTNYIAIDVETTGLSPRYGRIIEIGAISFSDNKLDKEFQCLINPGVPIPNNVSRINGINAAALRGQPTPECIFPKLRKFIGSATLIAHNASFDIAFLQTEFRRCGLDLVNPSICTLKMSRKMLPGLSDYKLATVYSHLFGTLPTDKLHRALTDARMAGHIWLELIKL